MDVIWSAAPHHLNSDSPDAAKQLRRCCRRLRWNKRPALLRRPLLILYALIWPIRLLPSMLKQTFRYGRAAREESGLSIPRQFLHQWLFCTRRGWWPLAYYKYRLHLPDRRARQDEFFHEIEILPILRHINAGDTMRLLDDKFSFARACAQHDLPHLPTIAHFENGTLTHPQSDPALPATDLIIKRTDSLCGRSVQRWRFSAHAGAERGAAPDASASTTYIHNAITLTPDRLFAHLRSESRQHPIIVQPRIHNHESIAHLSPGGLCTIRIVTARSATGQPQFILGAFRMPVGDACVDNFEAGGIAAPIDRATARLGPAVSKNPARPPLDKHPDTAADIAGFVLPFWHDAIELALRAHRAFGDIATVGWDIALTTDGPVLVEANPVWCPELIQMAHGLGLGATLFPALALTHITLRRPDRAARPTALFQQHLPQPQDFI